MTALRFRPNEPFETNRRLGESAKRIVGTGANQIPDMSFFPSLKNGNGYQGFPSGILFQYGTCPVVASLFTSTIEINFPIPFPNTARAVVALFSTEGPSERFVGYNIGLTNAIKVALTYVSPTANTISWLAIGY
ncbi:hypothetical protein NGK36_22665 [Hafnia alvei]|uniref:gp53-like domain-containing protein n=1 Tax=Hafnia alvei TaxID=569 RepID=UPI002DBC5A8B|nr:hypothetical protein [Hafnia alvei]MEB7892052.1 hypothetical protein [Hafnia alvei]